MGVSPEGNPGVATETGEVLSVPFWHAPWDFFVHTLFGTLIFGIIAVGAAFIELGVGKLAAIGVNGVIMVGLKGAEYALFATDLFLFVVFLWRTAKRTMKNL